MLRAMRWQLAVASVFGVVGVSALATARTEFFLHPDLWEKLKDAGADGTPADILGGNYGWALVLVMMLGLFAGLGLVLVESYRVSSEARKAKEDRAQFVQDIGREFSKALAQHGSHAQVQPAARAKCILPWRR